MANEFEIRPAQVEDCADLMSLIHAHAEFEGSKASISQRQMHELLVSESPPTAILVATGNSGLLGYAALTIDYALWRAHHWGHLDCLFVHADYRGQSIGRTLFGAAANLASRLGADQMEWQTPAWNERAIAFYKTQGAIEAVKSRFVFR